MLYPSASELPPTMHPTEAFMTLSPYMEVPHNSFEEYISLPPLQQTHTLDGEELVVMHHGMRAEEYESHQEYSPKVSHQLAGAWAQIELAHVRDFQGASAEAQELIALAAFQTARCEVLIERNYQDHSEYFDRLYRTQLLHMYTEHFAQLGPMHWPERPTNFQQSAYTRVQEGLVEPLLYDFYTYSRPRTKEERNHLTHIRGLLGELVVLQTLNRMQAKQEHGEWAVAPASMRENCRLAKNAAQDMSSSAFDIKCTFADQTFVPIEVKWNAPEKAARYNPAVAFISANGAGLNAPATAEAMTREATKQPVSAVDAQHMQAMTDAVLHSIGQVSRLGASIY